MSNLISVIVPVYNVEKYLDKCIQSILGQTYSNLEVLLIDDGSTDSSGAICDKYAAQDSRVRVFHKPNGGVSSARNLGLDNARGEWVGWVDSDDYISADMYEKLYTTATSKNADIAYGSYVCKNSVEMPSDLISVPDFISQYLCCFMNPLWITLTRKRLYDNIKFDEDANIGEDLLVTAKMYYYAEKRVKVPNAVYYYRENISSITHLTNEVTLNSLVLHNLIELDKFFKKTTIYEEIKQALAIRILTSKRYILFEERNVLKWFNICPWTHKYIFENPTNGRMGKHLEYLIDIICRWLCGLKLIRL